ncbi:MAG TPA: DUF1194 domain-containing protein [Geminicoccaceae bacterium]
MLHLLGRPFALAVLLAWPATPLLAAEARVRTDANLITALDVSDSMMRHEERLEFEGLARAIVDPAVLDAIAGGRHGRIGFAVFTWSSGGQFEVLVPWTLIASMDDAKRVAATLRGFAIDRSSWERPRNGSGERGKAPELRTDISGTIDFAAALARAAQHPSRRAVINVSANGTDNVAEDPRAARDRAVAAGIVVNGLVMGGGRGLTDYFGTHVRGGAGSFVLEVAEPAALVDAMIEKLLRDLIAVRQAGDGAVPFD